MSVINNSTKALTLSLQLHESGANTGCVRSFLSLHAKSLTQWEGEHGAVLALEYIGLP